MGNLAVIDITGLSPLASQGVLGGSSALERSLEWARSIPDWSGTVLLASPDDPVPEGAQVRVILRESWCEEVLVQALVEASESSAGDNRADALFFARGDCPLMDRKVTLTLWELHYQYDAEYTFADGYPEGLVPQILSSELPGRLLPLAAGRKGRVERNSIFEILRQDINAFDVETHLSPEDLRMDRVSLTCDTRRNQLLTEKIWDAGGRDAESVCRLLPGFRAGLRSLPVYFPVQITDHCPQACGYCPFPMNGNPLEGRDHMDSGVFADLCRKVLDFSGDAVFNLSLWGEPASHPEIGTLIRSALTAGEAGVGPPVSRVLIETSGIGWDTGLLRELAEEYPDGRLMWIVSLDASDPELYAALRGEGMARAESCARELAKLFGSFCWIQAVRMNENEEHLEAFHRKWTDEGAQVIVQKYDTYANILPQRQPADLSPLNRIPCWHIKRDFCVLLDGSVPVCRVDMGRREALGNAFTDDLEAIWAAGDELHRQHVNGKYPGPCASCDEYYTFNF